MWLTVGKPDRWILIADYFAILKNMEFFVIRIGLTTFYQTKNTSLKTESLEEAKFE